MKEGNKEMLHMLEKMYFGESLAENYNERENGREREREREREEDIRKGKKWK